MDPTAALQARLPTDWRSAVDRKLTVDNTVRKITLTSGGYRLYGHATQVYFATRYASDATGTLKSGEAAPTTSDRAAPSAGSPGAGLAWPASGTAATGHALPTDTTVYEEIAVPSGQYINLYLCCGTTANPILTGPFQ